MCAKTLGQGQPAHSKCSYYYITAGKWARISITLTLNMQSIKPSQLSRNTPAAPGRSNFVYCQMPLTRKPKLGFPEPPAPPGAPSVGLPVAVAHWSVCWPDGEPCRQAVLHAPRPMASPSSAQGARKVSGWRLGCPGAEAAGRTGCIPARAGPVSTRAGRATWGRGAAGRVLQTQEQNQGRTSEPPAPRALCLPGPGTDALLRVPCTKTDTNLQARNCTSDFRLQTADWSSCRAQLCSELRAKERHGPDHSQRLKRGRGPSQRPSPGGSVSQSGPNRGPQAGRLTHRSYSFMVPEAGGP